MLSAIGTFYNVLFNPGSREYWETTFGGGKFKYGCLAPIICMTIGILMVASQTDEKKEIKQSEKNTLPTTLPGTITPVETIYQKMAKYSLQEFQKSFDAQKSSFSKDTTHLANLKNAVASETETILAQYKRIKKRYSELRQTEQTDDTKIKLDAVRATIFHYL